MTNVFTVSYAQPVPMKQGGSLPSSRNAGRTDLDMEVQRRDAYIYNRRRLQEVLYEDFNKTMLSANQHATCLKMMLTEAERYHCRVDKARRAAAAAAKQPSASESDDSDDASSFGTASTTSSAPSSPTCRRPISPKMMKLRMTLLDTMSRVNAKMRDGLAQGVDNYGVCLELLSSLRLYDPILNRGM